MGLGVQFPGAVRARDGAAQRGGRSGPAVVLGVLIAGFALAALPSAAIAQVRTIATLNAGASSGSGGGGSSGQLGNLDVVVLVDESGSETPAKIADEKATTLEIATSMLSPQSRVTVIGFGGVNNIVPDQDPTNVACQPTITSAANLGYLTSCVNGLYRRTEKDGDDTDYAVALGQAMSYLKPDSTSVPQSPPGATKVILMMTDGAVDVHRNMQQYGADWREGELTQIDDLHGIGTRPLARSDHSHFYHIIQVVGTDVHGKHPADRLSLARRHLCYHSRAERNVPRP